MEVNRQIKSFQLKKAYMISLCLAAQRVVAESTSEEAAVAEKTLLDQVLQALKEPSGEHMQIYIGLGLVLTILAGIVMMATSSEKTVKVTLDDVDDPNAAAKPRKKAGVKKPAGAAAKPAASYKGGQAELTVDKDAIFKELDENGPFEKTITGALEPSSFVKLRRTIGKHAYLTFVPRKDQMMNERLGHLKAQRMKEYQVMIQKASQEYAKIQFEVTKLAAEFIDLDEANFEASMNAAMSDPEIAKQLKTDDENVRTRAEPAKDNLSKDKAKQILIEKIKMEFETERKLSTLQLRSQEEAQAIVMIERTRVMDELYMKYQVKLGDLQHAIKKYDLENDEECKTVKMANLAAREQMVKAKQEEMKASLKVSDEEEKEVKQVCKDIGDIDITPGMDGCISFDEYLKIFTAVVTLQIRFCTRLDDAHRDERRTALSSGNQQGFAQAGTKMLGAQAKAKQAVTLAALAELKVEPELYSKSGQAAKGAPERGEQMKNTAQSVELQERLRLAGPGYEPLEKDVALKHIEAIEMLKVQVMAGAIIAHKMGKIPQSKMPLVQEMAKLQALDTYNKTVPIEDTDIIIAFNKYNLAESDEFKAVMGRAQQALQAHVNQVAQQMQAQMQAQQRGGMPPGMMQQQRQMAAPQGPPQGGDPDPADLGW